MEWGFVMEAEPKFEPGSGVEIDRWFWSDGKGCRSRCVCGSRTKRWVMWPGFVELPLLYFLLSSFSASRSSWPKLETDKNEWTTMKKWTRCYCVSERPRDFRVCMCGSVNGYSVTYMGSVFKIPNGNGKKNNFCFCWLVFLTWKRLQHNVVG